MSVEKSNTLHEFLARVKASCRRLASAFLHAPIIPCGCFCVIFIDYFSRYFFWRIDAGAFEPSRNPRFSKAFSHRLALSIFVRNNVAFNKAAFSSVVYDCDRSRFASICRFSLRAGKFFGFKSLSSFCKVLAGTHNTLLP